MTALDAPLGPTSGPVTGARVNTGAMLGRLVHRSYLNTKRIPVSVVLDCLADGMAIDEIIGQYPSLTSADVRAAAAYGAALAREEVLHLAGDR